MASIAVVDERAAFLAERRTGIGGSDIIHLFNEPQYGKGCARYLMYDKMGADPDYVIDADPGVLKRGNRMESVIAEEYEEDTGRKLRRAGVRRHPDYPWALVHMDRQVLAGSGDRAKGTYVTETGAAEIKSFNDWAFRIMERNGILLGTMLQIQQSMFVPNYRWAAFVGMRVTDFRLWHMDVPRDEELIDLIKRKGDLFWNAKEKGELPDQLPDPEDARCQVCVYRKTCRGQALNAEAVKALGKDKQVLVQIDTPSIVQNVEDLKVLKAEIKDMEALHDTIERKIKEEIVAREAATGDSLLAWEVPGVKVYFKPGTTSRLDGEGIKAKHPDIYKEFYQTGIPTARSLRLFPKQ